MDFTSAILFGSTFTLPFIIAVAWTLVWKGWALWLAARRGEKWWFVALLLINTLGILEIVYIFFIAKRKDGVELRRDASNPA